MKEHMYILSITAVSTTGVPRIELGLFIRVIFAPTFDEAKSTGHVVARELMPQEKGWSGHYVEAKRVSTDMLERALRGADGSGGDEEEWAEIIM